MATATTNKLTPEQGYEVAIQVSCPWSECGAMQGQRCNDDLFPQYPHIERFEKALKDSGRLG